MRAQTPKFFPMEATETLFLSVIIGGALFGMMIAITSNVIKIRKHLDSKNKENTSN